LAKETTNGLQEKRGVRRHIESPGGRDFALLHSSTGVSQELHCASQHELHTTAHLLGRDDDDVVYWYLIQ
jgi:hypothetical protein